MFSLQLYKNRMNFEALTFVELLGLVSRMAIGFVVLGICAFAVIHMYTRMWRLFTPFYRASFDKNDGPRKAFGAAVITEQGNRWGIYEGSPNYHRYAPIILTVLPDGLGMELVRPFRFGNPQLKLPYKDMQICIAKWALWGESVALHMDRREGYDIILYSEAGDWAAEHSPQVAAMLNRAKAQMEGQPA